MVSHSDLQDEYVSKLKAYTPLTAETSDIREEGYKGRDYTYPNVRVQISMQSSKGDSCRERHSVVSGVVTVYVENDSSQRASDLIKLCHDALVGRQIWASGWHIATIKSNGMRSPVRHDPDLWKGELFFYGNVYETI